MSSLSARSITGSLLLCLLAWQTVLAAGAAAELAAAVRRDDNSAVEALLEAGADAAGTDHAGRPLLVLAASTGHADIVQALLRQGADINAVDSDGRTSLMLAAAGGHLATVEILLAGKPELDRQDANGMTALHWAAMRARPQVAAMLVGQGAAVNIRDKAGATPLLFAVSKAARLPGLLIRSPCNCRTAACCSSTRATVLAPVFPTGSRPSLCATKSRVAAPSSRRISITRNRSR